MKKSFLAFLLLFITHFVSYGQQTDSLEAMLNGSTGSERIEVLHNLVVSIWHNYPTQAMSYGKEALAISDELIDSTYMSKSLRLIAGVYYYRGDFETSLDYNLRALEIAERISDSTLINNGYNNIGLLFYNLGSYQTALEYLLRALQIKQIRGEVYGLSTTLNNIGLVFSRVSDYPMARKYFSDALTLSQQNKNNSQIVYSQNNLAITHLRQGNFEDARAYFSNSLSLAQDIGNINWGAVSLRGIGEVFQNNMKYDSASFYYGKSLEASLSIDDKKGMAEVHYLYARLAYLQNNPSEAIECLSRSYVLASQQGDRQQLLENLELYATLYRSIGDEKGVIKYQTKYIDLRDSLFEDVVTRNLLLVPIKLKEEGDRIRLSSQRTEIEKKNFTNQLYIFIIIIAAPLIILLIILLRKIRRVNQLQKNTLDEIAFVEAHQLRGPISSLLGLIDLIESKSAHPHDFKLYLEKIKGLSVKIDLVIREIIKRTDTNEESAPANGEQGEVK